MASTSIWDLMMMSKDEIRSRHPASRRFFQSGFEPDPKNHGDDTLGLISLQQVIRLNLVTGDFVPVPPASF